MDRKYFVSYEIAKLLKEKGYPQEHEWFYCDNGKGITPSWDGSHCDCSDGVARPTYFEVIDWLDMEGYIVTVEYDSTHNNGIRAFRSVVYNLYDKLYTSEWKNSRGGALNDGITEIFKDYL